MLLVHAGTSRSTRTIVTTYFVCSLAVDKYFFVGYNAGLCRMEIEILIARFDFGRIEFALAPCTRAARRSTRVPGTVVRTIYRTRAIARSRVPRRYYLYTG